MRRRVLRAGRPERDIRFPEDDREGAFHLAARDPDVLAVATFFPSPTPYRPGRRSWQLRGMAVESGRQGEGIGRVVLEAALQRLRTEGAEVLWANVRDTAMGFYQRLGWQVVGEGFINEMGLPHHVAVLDLILDLPPSPPPPPPA